VRGAAADGREMTVVIDGRNNSLTIDDTGPFYPSTP